MPPRVEDLHDHFRSCLLRIDSSITIGVSIEPSGSGVVVHQITPIDVLDVTTDYDACCDICSVRVRTVEGESVEGKIKRFNVYPLVTIESLNGSLVNLYSKQNRGSLISIRVPNGHLVVPLTEKEEWSYVYAIVSGRKFGGWIHFEESRFSELP
jgi:hypothetical protein